MTAAADRLMLTDSSWPLAGIIIVFAVFISIAMTGQTLDSFALRKATNGTGRTELRQLFTAVNKGC
ncbi:hypothetical protein D7S44_22890 [Pantoea piersonii]|jgi:hypothetical protein|nr:hypothetical protein D7S44_22890 [Pantoea piersonii]